MQTLERAPTMTDSTQIPAVFIWTKVGAEAGQSMARILHRKELERQVGHGLFCWGIGNALGAAPRIAREQSEGGNVEVLFTKMKSLPKAADESPSSVLLWVDYEDANGLTRPLPDHVLTTSRGDGPSGKQKTHHYALMCHASSPIAEEDLAAFDSAQVANLVSSNPVGASQVTSVVRYRGETAATSPYSVFFRAWLHGDGVVRLKTPIVLSGPSFDLYDAVCEAGSPSAWTTRLRTLRAYVLAENKQRRSQLDLPLYA
jgi:hypothetical protein